MATNTQARIAERIAAAHENMSRQGMIRRSMSRLGLGAANAVDRLTAWGNNDKVVVATGGIMGAISGIVWGGAMGLVALAFFVTPGAYTAALGATVLMTGACIGALYGGIHTGLATLRKHRNTEHWRLSDAVAYHLGAVNTPPHHAPKPPPPPAPPHKASKGKKGHSPHPHYWRMRYGNHEKHDHGPHHHDHEHAHSHVEALGERDGHEHSGHGL